MTERCPLKIAHISDLHFAKLSYNPLQIFSKRLLGTLNVLFFRKKTLFADQVYRLIGLFKEKKITHVLISGDLTTTSFKKEFELAKAFVQALEANQFKVFLIPGNHDHYTKKSCRNKLFYDYFPSAYIEKSPYNLKNHGVTSCSLGNKWHLIALDTTLATAHYLSSGCFSKKIQKNLEDLLKTLPKDDKVILMNHFPFFQNEQKRRRLKRGQDLEELLRKYPNVQFYLHGHTHRHCVADLRATNLPIILDSGSCSYIEGSWNFIKLMQDKAEISSYRLKKEPTCFYKSTHKWAIQ